MSQTKFCVINQKITNFNYFCSLSIREYIYSSQEKLCNCMMMLTRFIMVTIFAMYSIIKSLYYTTETNITCQLYLNLKKMNK